MTAAGSEWGRRAQEHVARCGAPCECGGDSSEHKEVRGAIKRMLPKSQMQRTRGPRGHEVREKYDNALALFLERRHVLVKNLWRAARRGEREFGC